MCGRYATTMGQMNLYGLFAAEPDPLEQTPTPAETTTKAGPTSAAGETERQPHTAPPVEEQPALLQLTAPEAAETAAGQAAAPEPEDAQPAQRDLAAGRYNIAPTSTVPVVLQRRDEDGNTHRYVRAVHWGLVPSWAKEVKVGNRMFNARAESLPQKPAFRAPLGKRRCLVPASGFFEWRKSSLPGGAGKPVKQPFYITPEDGSVLAFAGLWEFWRAPDGEPLVSATIITTDASGPMAEIHERMPLILPAADWDAWLDLDNSAQDIAPLLAPPDPALVEQLEFRPISKRVGSVANNDPGLLDRVPLGN